MSPAGARLDDVTLRWVIEQLDLPTGTGGGFVTGATTASAGAVALPRRPTSGDRECADGKRLMWGVG